MKHSKATTPDDILAWLKENKPLEPKEITWQYAKETTSEKPAALHDVDLADEDKPDTTEKVIALDTPQQKRRTCWLSAF